MTGRAPLAYHLARPDERYWTRHWAGESLDHLLAVAEYSEATRFIENFVHVGDELLEAGCGLGQYVAYFAARGVNAIGVDYSVEAIEAHRARFPDSSVMVADIADLPFKDASFDVYLSLGVIEHYEDGGRAILEEAHRVLRPDGRLLLSTPYLNLSRRLLRRRIERQQAAVAHAGGHFYQFAFDEQALDGILAESGFAVVRRSFYDPGRGVRDLRMLLRPRVILRNAASPRQPQRHGALKRAMLYALPTLKLLAHMQIVVAQKRNRPDNNAGHYRAI